MNTEEIIKKVMLFVMPIVSDEYRSGFRDCQTLIITMLENEQ